MKKETTTKRNEEIIDIIERMPTRFGKWVAIAVILFTVLLLTFGWAIKYPDVVTGQITINSTVSPVKLVAGSNGKIHLNHFHAKDQVNEGDYIAVIQNSAKTEDVKKIAALVANSDPNEDSFLRLTDSLPEKVSLGELNLKYFTFLTAIKNIDHYEKENTYERQEKSLEEYIKWQNILIEQTKIDTITSKEKLTMIGKWLQRKNALYKKEYDYRKRI